jgi:uncharacterized membrane protein YphA (DoxX/SURF4 family)
LLSEQAAHHPPSLNAPIVIKITFNPGHTHIALTYAPWDDRAQGGSAMTKAAMLYSKERFDQLDRRITRWMARYGLLLLRLGLGVAFLWFGALKLVPDLSPAQDLAARTISMLSLGLLPASVSVPLLAIWECAIGLGLIIGRLMRVTILLLLVQMLGTLTPLVLLPAETWTIFLLAPTLEGQYIIKNIVLVSAALVIGATVRGGYVLAEPGDCR